MAISLNTTVKYNGVGSGVLPVAPSINSALTPGTFDWVSDNYSGWIEGSATTGETHGGRITFTSNLDLTDRDYVIFQMCGAELDGTFRFETVANAGLRIYFVDGSGNYSGFNIYGNDITGYVNNSQANYLSAFHSTNVTQCMYLIDRSATPDVTSGTLDWSDVDAIETHITNDIDGGVGIGFALMKTYDTPVATGTENFSGFADAHAEKFFDNGPEENYQRIFEVAEDRFKGASEIPYNVYIGCDIGNGSTTTTFTDSNFAIGFSVFFSDQANGFSTVGPYVITDDPRLITINQAAADTVTLTDGSFSSGSGWGIVVTGSTSGTCTFTRNVFANYGQFECAHATFTDCTWSGGSVAIEIDGNTAITGSTILNAEGLEITSAAGDYSDIDVRFDGNTTYDVIVGDGGAGTYDLTGISVAAGYTLKVRNAHATNAVTVTIPTGITSSTSTAGGTLTVNNPANTVDITITAQETDGTVIENARVYLTANGTTADYTDGDVILSGLTNASGVLTTNETATVAQAVEGWVRKATGTPLYKEAVLSGTISATTGYIQTAILIADE